MNQRILVASVKEMSEPEPAFVEFLLVLGDGTQATLRMNIFEAQKMAGLISQVGA